MNSSKCLNCNSIELTLFPHPSNCRLTTISRTRVLSETYLYHLFITNTPHLPEITGVHCSCTCNHCRNSCAKERSRRNLELLCCNFKEITVIFNRSMTFEIPIRQLSEVAKILCEPFLILKYVYIIC
jgi:hypothetical protein